MDSRLFNRVFQNTPKFNPQIAEGLAKSQLARVSEYIHQVLETAASAFPPELQYTGFARCTPLEEYAQMTMTRSGAQSYEHSKSTIYLNKYLFEFNGVPLKPRYMFMPHVGDAGMITISGSVFSVSPVLADNSVSIGQDSVFIPLNRDKLTFKRLNAFYYANGTREAAYVVYGSLYHSAKKKPGSTRRTVNPQTTCMHYLLCKYGLSETFRKFANTEIVVGYSEINEQTHPPSEWVICKSAQIKPRGANARTYRPTEVRIAVRLEQYDQNLTLQSMIASFFYIADHFPERILAEFADDTNLWRILLGHLNIASNNESEGKLLNGINAHMDSIDDYVDGMVREWFIEDGIRVNDIYELLMYVIETLPYMVATAGDVIASMYDKRLTVMRYLLIDIIMAIFNMLFNVKKAAKKGLTANDVENIMQRTLKTHLIMRINTGHAEVSSVSNPSDCMVFKVTSNIVLQSRATGPAGAKSKSSTFDSTKVLHSSIAEVASYNHQPKGEPTGRNRINPFLQLGPDGRVLADPAKEELLTRTQLQFIR